MADRIDEAINSIPAEQLDRLAGLVHRDLLLAYTCYNAGDLFARRCQKHVEKYLPYTHFQKRKEANMMLKYIGLAIRQLDVESIQADQTFYNGVESYDSIREDAYELVRLIQLYADRCDNGEKAKQVQDLLMAMEDHHLFTEEEINIKMKR